MAIQNPVYQMAEMRMKAVMNPPALSMEKKIKPMKIGARRAKTEMVSFVYRVKRCLLRTRKTFSSGDWPSNEFGESFQIERNF